MKNHQIWQKIKKSPVQLAINPFLHGNYGLVFGTRSATNMGDYNNNAELLLSITNDMDQDLMVF